MDRKKTIVIAVMINAGLLAVLFIAAMTMREEPASQTDLESPKPLFGDRIEIPAPSPMTDALPIEIPIAPLVLKPEESIAHQLPPREIVTPALSTPIAPNPVPAGVEIAVQKGDSLEKIAKQHHTSVDEIIKLNQLPSSFLKIGQRLKIPVEKTLPSVPKAKPIVQGSSDQAEYYTMKVGDNPWSIAMKHHLKVDELLKLNGLNEEKARKLKPGDRLKIR